MRKFLDRIVALSGRLTDEAPAEAVQRVLAKATQKVGTDTERFKYNTAISGLMVLMNELEALAAVPKSAYLQLVTLLAPYAPHVAEYLFESTQLTSTHGSTESSDAAANESIHQQPWPEVDEALLIEEAITLGVQVGGKRRGEVTLGPDSSEEEALAAALAVPEVVKYLTGGKPSRVVYVPGRILNLIP
jgi:leucyl-tRNA synthetase